MRQRDGVMKRWREEERKRESRDGMRTERRLLRQTGNERGQEEKSKNESERERRTFTIIHHILTEH